MRHNTKRFMAAKPFALYPIGSNVPLRLQQIKTPWHNAAIIVRNKHMRCCTPVVIMLNGWPTIWCLPVIVVLLLFVVLVTAKITRRRLHAIQKLKVVSEIDEWPEQSFCFLDAETRLDNNTGVIQVRKEEKWVDTDERIDPDTKKFQKRTPAGWIDA